jgi:class 3 adenylate cyclase
MPPSEERKLVTVLFGDLVGSTELALQRDPEQFRAMLSAFFEEMAQQIRVFGGTVEKYAGDAIMAVFGVPQGAVGRGHPGRRARPPGCVGDTGVDGDHLRLGVARSRTSETRPLG